MLSLTKNPLSFVLDLAFPKFNLNYSSPYTYLTQSEIKAQKSFLKTDLTEGYQKFLDKVLVCSHYSEPIIEDLITRAKVNGELAIAGSLVDLIKAKTKKNQIPKPDMLIFVPPDKVRFKQRGYHLPYQVAHKLSSSLEVPIANIIFKSKSTVSQTNLKRKDRLTNLENAFELRLNNFNFNKNSIKKVWLIDDVVSTGATLLECAKVFKQKFKETKVYGVIIAGK